MKLNNTLLLILSVLVYSIANAQLITPAPLPNWVSNNANQLKQKTVLVQLETPDLVALQLEDAENDNRKDKPYRTSTIHEVNKNLLQSASVTKQGEKAILTWHLEATGAKHLSYFFSDFFLPESALLYIVNNTTGDYYGAFGSNNHISTGTFATSPFAGDNHTLVVSLNESELPLLRLQLKEVYRGYRGSAYQKRGEGDSEACNININCPLGDDFQVVKRAVVHILAPSGNCSGTLVNNTANNGKQYVLTAQHCLPSNLNVSNWRFKFGFEGIDCAAEESVPFNTVSGAQLLAHNAPTDFALVEILQPIPIEYEPYFAGWDIDGPTGDVAPVFGIHHPSSDIKKISKANSTVIGTCFNTPGTNCFELVWEQGTTEGGSSGSALMDADGYVIGNLSGGQASCSLPNETDFYGMLKYSFSIDPDNPQTNAKQWLDKGKTGIRKMPPYDPLAPTDDIDLSISNIEGVSSLNCEGTVSPIIFIYNAGKLEAQDVQVLISLDGNTLYNNSISVPSSGSQAIELGQMTLSNGSHNLVVEVTDNSGTETYLSNNATTHSFQTNNTGSYYTVEVTIDFWGSENSWKFVDANGFTYAQGGPYPEQQEGRVYLDTICVPEGCSKFHFTDSYGDGFEISEAGYLVRNPSGTIVAQGWSTPIGPEGVPITETFDVCNVGVNETIPQPIVVFPNPADKQFYVKSTQKILSLTLVDITGKVMNTELINGYTPKIETENLESGVYLLRLNTADGNSFSKRLVVTH